jgi:hypothetical protein
MVKTTILKLLIKMICHASHAGHAGRAGHVGRASHAGHASHASHAGHAGRAGHGSIALSSICEAGSKDSYFITDFTAVSQNT